MAVYVIYAMAVFSAANRRDRVVNQAQTSAAANGFAPSSRVPGYPPGTTSFDWTVPLDSDDTTVTPGATYPAARIAYEHTDQALVAQAEQVIENEMDRQGWLYGQVGTWTDLSG